MDCNQCKALEQAVERYEWEYVSARVRLEELAGTDNVKEFNRARTLAEDARMKFDSVRTQLEQHQQTIHGASK